MGALKQVVSERMWLSAAAASAPSYSQHNKPVEEGWESVDGVSSQVEAPRHWMA